MQRYPFPGANPTVSTLPAGSNEALIRHQDFQGEGIEVCDLPQPATLAFQKNPARGAIRLIQRGEFDTPDVYLRIGNSQTVASVFAFLSDLAHDPRQGFQSRPVTPQGERLLRQQDVTGNNLGPVPANDQGARLFREISAGGVHSTQLNSEFKFHTVAATFVDGHHSAPLREVSGNAPRCNW